MTIFPNRYPDSVNFMYTKLIEMVKAELGLTYFEVSKSLDYAGNIVTDDDMPIDFNKVHVSTDHAVTDINIRFIGPSIVAKRKYNIVFTLQDEGSLPYWIAEVSFSRNSKLSWAKYHTVNIITYPDDFPQMFKFLKQMFHNDKNIR